MKTRTCQKVHPPVTGTVRMVEAPRLPTPNAPGCCGLVRINDQTYALAYVSEPGDGGLVVTGYRLCSGEADIYDIPADLRVCECKDYLVRVREDGMCKHLKALRALRANNKIS